jgi:hypothetical protein
VVFLGEAAFGDEEAAEGDGGGVVDPFGHDGGEVAGFEEVEVGGDDAEEEGLIEQGLDVGGLVHVFTR